MAVMASAWVIRLFDKNNNPILINVSRKEGGHAVDLDLLATDGETAFTTKVRQRSLKRLKAKNYDGSDDEWVNVVLHVLDPTTKPDETPSNTSDLELACSISKKTLTITFDNKVEEITQRLGAIELSETDDTDNIDLFGWTAQVIEQRDDLQNKITASETQAKSKDEAIASLQKQLNELVAAKIEHEQQLFSKFALLLNEKKLKIRNMQRILNTARPDAKKIQELAAMLGSEQTDLPRRKKRGVDEEEAEADADEDEAFETMDVDTAANIEPDPDSEQEQNTPEASGNEAETDDEEDISGAAERPKLSSTLVKATPLQSSPMKSATSATKTAPKAPEVATTNDDDDATASEDEDDEL